MSSLPVNQTPLNPCIYQLSSYAMCVTWPRSALVKKNSFLMIITIIKQKDNKFCKLTTQATYIQRNNEAHSRNHCCSGKAILHMCVRVSAYACVCPDAWEYACACLHVALLIHHATRMRHIVTSYVATLAPPYFSILSHKRHNFRKKKKLLNIRCVF